MRKRMSCLLVLILLSGNIVSQTYIEPVIGCQDDLSNHNKFQQINTGIQAAFRKSRRYELIVRIQKSRGFPYHASDSSYTVNPALPLYSIANKTIHPDSWYLSLDHRFIFKGSQKNHQFSILLFTGFSEQILKVDYQYDKQDYIILNPDKTQRGFSLSIGTGLEYMQYLKNNRLFFRLTFDAPIAGNQMTYPSSFNFMSPLALNVGYSILIKKKKNGN